MHLSRCNIVVDMCGCVWIVFTYARVVSAWVCVSSCVGVCVWAIHLPGNQQIVKVFPNDVVLGVWRRPNVCCSRKAEKYIIHFVASIQSNWGRRRHDIYPHVYTYTLCRLHSPAALQTYSSYDGMQHCKGAQILNWRCAPCVRCNWSKCVCVSVGVGAWA